MREESQLTHDARFQITITDRNGSNLSSEADLGTLQQVQEVFGRGQTCRASAVHSLQPAVSLS